MSVDEIAPEDNDQLRAEKAERKRRKKEKKLLKAQQLELQALEPSSVDNAEAEDESSKEERTKKKKKTKLTVASEISNTAESSNSESRKDEKKKRKREEVDDAKSEKKKRKNGSSNLPETKDQEMADATRSTPSKADIQAFLEKHSIKIDSDIQPILEFEQLDIPEMMRASLSGFKEPTPIQAYTWPPALQGRDVIGIAETGSGKTLGFGIPALSRLISSPSSSKSSISVLVVAPTRELALQTHDTLSDLGKPFGISSVAVFGGVPKEPQIKMLEKATKSKKTVTRIAVGTPGRLLDLINDGVCDLSCVEYLVLDEADRMLDKGFENDIRKIISFTSKERQTMMFSATWPESVRRLASTFLRDPVRVTVGSDDLTANSRVEQVVEVFDDARSKDTRLLAQLRSFPKKKTPAEDSRILIFALYKKEASRVEQMLHQKGYSVGALHGDMGQTNRMEALDAFKTGKTSLLVATDVAARGLDIPDVSMVINYTFPLTIEDYIHRIGRTGRGGKTGKSVTYFTGDNHERSLAGELARVLRESGFTCEGLKKFPMTIKKKEHGVYGAFFRDDIAVPKAPTKITFD